MSVRDHILLNNSLKFPVIGLGTWQAEPSEIKTAIDTALEVGYRHIDTAFSYMNEEAIGDTLQEWFNSKKLKRGDLFITTKLPMPAVRPEDVEPYLRESLKRLKLKYVDLYLIHCPIGLKPVDDNVNNTFPTLPDGTVSLDPVTDLPATWKAMEAQVDNGLAKSIGVSNFNCVQIEKIVRHARILPVTDQVELHVEFMQKPLRALCKLHNIVVTAYAPIGSPGRTKFYAARGQKAPPIPCLIHNPLVGEVAKKHNKSNAQVLLRHLLQHGLVVIPKSCNPKRIKENFQLMDFQLDSEDMKKLDSLDKGAKGRTFDFLLFKGIDQHPEYPFVDEY
ncbi:aldo-keto reductase family 1 member A1-like [Artemia franciscana]|uniref:NADP-dependent oxidoreductase domain-containing protein n=1 Tax=Artemia franciscana TaxID=6661 RepID=A0AA88HK95_ARTSF|nr:hypothetical protein QYM36_015052 [Artemia franciscana]